MVRGWFRVQRDRLGRPWLLLAIAIQAVLANLPWLDPGEEGRIPFAVESDGDPLLEGERPLWKMQLHVSPADGMVPCDHRRLDLGEGAFCERQIRFPVSHRPAGW